MLHKGLLFAAAAALAALSAPAAVHASPVSMGLAPQGNDAAIVKVDYYYPGYDAYGEGPYPGNGLLELPFAVLGGVAGIVGGALDGAFHGVEYAGEPYYGPAYDSGTYYSPKYYRDTYYGRDYNGSAYYSPQYYGDTHYDRDYDSDTAYSSRYYNDTDYGREGDDGTYYGGRYNGYKATYEEPGASACAREFRSFDPASGTYTTYDGAQVLCPYLER